MPLGAHIMDDCGDGPIAVVLHDEHGDTIL